MAFRVDDAGTSGKGVFGAKDFKPGDVIFKLSRPLVTALDTPAFEYTCEWCFNGVDEAALGQSPIDQQGSSGVEIAETRLLRCTGCRLVKYCSKRCQSQAWKHHHKLECKVFAQFMPKVLPPASRMIIQLVLRKQKGLLSEQEWAQFMLLQHHIKFFMETPPQKGDIKRLQVGALATKQFCQLPDSVEQIETWFARLYVNAQTLVNPIFHPLGQCLDPLPSTINHSCLPNAVITFSGPEMTLRATATIPSNTEITISYIDPTPIAAVRQWELGEKYFFKCQCPACVQNSYCGQPDPPLSFRQSKNDFEVLNSLAKLDEVGLEFMENVKGKEQGEDSRWLEVCQGLTVYLQQENIDCYPPGRQPFAWLRFEAVVELLSRGEFLPAMILSLQTYYDADPVHFPYYAHPVRVMHAYTLSKLAHHMHYLDCMHDRIVEAMSKQFDLSEKWADVSYALLGEVLSCLELSHGADSRLTQQARMEGLATMQVPKAVKFINGQDTKALGIRDQQRWKGTYNLARKGWQWYQLWLDKYVETNKLDAGLKILIQPKQESTPTLLKP